MLQRRPEAHKGDHGGLGVLGGAPGMVGAALLAARMALYAGAGRVYIVRPSLHDGFVVDPTTPELMVVDHANSKTRPITVWAIGPGLGVSDAAHQCVADAFGSGLPLVADADALNLMAEDPALGRLCSRRKAPAVITPHPGEAARLLGVTVADIQLARQAHATALADKFKAIVVLKGHHTVIAGPDGDCTINSTGNAALATGGTGDVLTGLIGGLMAQQVEAREAAHVATRLHGQAGEELTQRVGGMIGITASELIPTVRQLINALTR